MTTETRLNTFLGKTPYISPSVFVSPHALLQGDVRLGSLSSVWPFCVLRADINYIEIGEGTNIQENSILHLSDDYPVCVGNYTTIGHRVTLHACVVESECLIGMGSTIMDGARIGANSIVGAHSLITGRTVVPPGSLVIGAPARVVRQLNLKEQKGIRAWAEKYIIVAEHHKKLISTNSQGAI